MRLKLILLTFIAFSLPQIGNASGICSALLTGEQLAILQQAVTTSEHYKVAVYSGTVAGKARTVVFLGETHVKDKANSDLGKQVIEKFDAYGLEGADVSKTWGGKILSLSLDAMSLAFKIFTMGKVNQGSTIHDAAKRGVTRELLEVLKKVAIDLNLATLSKEEADKTQIKIFEATISGSKVLDLISELEVEAEKEPLVFALEEGHQPGVAENIASVAIPGVFAACAYSIVSTVCQIGTSVSSGDGMGGIETIGAIAGALVITKGLSRILGKYNVVNNAIRYSLDLSLGQGRNRTMVDNVLKALEANPALDTLLVIVGSNHISGMGQLLNRQAGFQTIPLNQVGIRQTVSP